MADRRPLTDEEAFELAIEESKRTAELETKMRDSGTPCRIESTVLFDNGRYYQVTPKHRAVGDVEKTPVASPKPRERNSAMRRSRPPRSVRRSAQKKPEISEVPVKPTSIDFGDSHQTVDELADRILQQFDLRDNSAWQNYFASRDSGGLPRSKDLQMVRLRPSFSRRLMRPTEYGYGASSSSQPSKGVNSYRGAPSVPPPKYADIVKTAQPPVLPPKPFGRGSGAKCRTPVPEEPVGVRRSEEQSLNEPLVDLQGKLDGTLESLSSLSPEKPSGTSLDPLSVKMFSNGDNITSSDDSCAAKLKTNPLQAQNSTIVVEAQIQEATRKDVNKVFSAGWGEPEISACVPVAIVETEIHLSCADDKFGLTAQHCPLQKESATARVPFGRAGRGQAAKKPLQPKPVGI